MFKKLLTPEEQSDLSDFAGMLNTFDVKTILPLILFLNGEVGLQGAQLQQVLLSLESFSHSACCCGLTTKNYNRLFLQLVEGLRGKEDIVVALRTELLKGEGEAVVWPDDATFSHAWLTKNFTTICPRSGCNTF